MQAAYITVSIIIVIASVLLTLVVLVQNSKGGGLAANFAAGNSTFGVRQTADLLEKVTWILAIIVLVLCIVATFLIPRSNESHSQIKSKIENTTPVEGQPAFPEATMTYEEAVEAAEAAATDNAE